ncbi:hypothetical protein DV515_00019788, partial [Chloebia gouldiae]
EGVWPQGWQRRWQGAVPCRALTGSVFPGMAGCYLKGQPAELRLLTQAGAGWESCNAGQGAAIPVPAAASFTPCVDQGWCVQGTERFQGQLLLGAIHPACRYLPPSSPQTLPIPIFTLHNSSLLIALSHQPPLLRFPSMPSSVHTHRGRRAGEAGKVPVLKVHFPNTVELQILLSTLEPLGFGRANLRIPWQASTEGKGAWNAGTQQCPIPAQDKGEGRSSDHPGLTGSFGLGGATLPVPRALPGSAGMPAAVLGKCLGRTGACFSRKVLPRELPVRQ